MQLCLGANEVGERGANEVPKFILPTEPPPPPPATAAPTSTNRTTSTTTRTSTSTSTTTTTSTMDHGQQAARHQQHQYYDHPSTTISTNTKTSTTSTIVSSSSTTTSTRAPCRNLLCTCQYVCARFKNLKLRTAKQKMLARRFLYLHMFEMLPLVRYTAHKQTCIHKQIARMQALENWKWKRNKVLRTTLKWYMNYKSICKKSPKYCGHADWYDFPPSDAT